jgi:two-component system, OmpR family, phosphate regulon response regulator PhoB
MTGKEILIVEDEAPIRQMIAYNIRRAGFDVAEAEDGLAVRQRLLQHHPDLVLMDWMLPGESGFELLRMIKGDIATREIPVIMLTARVGEAEKVAALQVGADDFVTKPFSPVELLARIKAVLRRRAATATLEMIEIGGLTLDRAAHRALADGSNVPLGPSDYRMLEFFMLHPDRVYARDQLLDKVWGSNVCIEDRTIDVHIRRLRRALEPFGYDHLVQTVRGVGYRFSARSE